MWRVGIVSYWTVLSGEWVIQAVIDYDGQCELSDVGGTAHTQLIPNENLATVEAWCSDDVLERMRTDPQIRWIAFEEEIVEVTE